jgi:hypothetical protein
MISFCHNFTLKLNCWTACKGQGIRDPLRFLVIKKIFGSLPDHVVYVPVDLGIDALGEKLLVSGHDKSKKPLHHGRSHFYIPQKW